MADKAQVDVSDLQKLHDALGKAVEFHTHRDRMNAALHLASETRFSPLTSSLIAEYERLSMILSVTVD